MALSTYADLQTAVTTWTRRADMSTYSADIITVAENRIFREVRCREMETALNATISNGLLTVPTDYAELKNAYIDGTPIRNLERKSPEWILREYPLRSSQGKPYFIGRDVGSFIFGPYPDSAYTVKGTYYKRLSPLSSAVNDLYTNNPDLYLAATLSEAFGLLRNKEERDKWEADYLSIKSTISTQDKAERISGGPLTMVPA